MAEKKSKPQCQSSQSEKKKKINPKKPLPKPDRSFDSLADDPLSSFSYDDYGWAARHNRPIRGIKL